MRHEICLPIVQSWPSVIASHMSILEQTVLHVLDAAEQTLVCLCALSFFLNVLRMCMSAAKPDDSNDHG